MTRFLDVSESLEEFRTRLSEAKQRPVYIASCLWHGNGTHYRKPGGKKYQPMGTLELFLSQWDDHGTCVERVPREGGDEFHFDLFPAKLFCLVYPISKGEISLAEDRMAKYEDFSVVGLRTSINSHRRPTFLSREDNVPSELQAYVAEYKRVRQVTGTGILFGVSEYIEAPIEMRKDWHLGLRVAREHDPTFHTLQAPGQYSGRSIVNLEGINPMAVLECDPGPCNICHGKSGERRHISPIAFSDGAYPCGHICRVCSKSAFASWQALLDSDTILT